MSDRVSEEETSYKEDPNRRFAKLAAFVGADAMIGVLSH